MHPDIKIQVSYDKKQSTLGSSSTILHPLTEVRGRKIARTVNKPNRATVRATFLQKTLENKIRGRYASGYQNLGKL